MGTLRVVKCSLVSTWRQAAGPHLRSVTNVRVSMKLSSFGGFHVSPCGCFLNNDHQAETNGVPSTIISPPQPARVHPYFHLLESVRLSPHRLDCPSQLVGFSCLGRSLHSPHCQWPYHTWNLFALESNKPVASKVKARHSSVESGPRP